MNARFRGPSGRGGGPVVPTTPRVPFGCGIRLRRHPIGSGLYDPDEEAVRPVAFQGSQRTLKTRGDPWTLPAPWRAGPARRGYLRMPSTSLDWTSGAAPPPRGAVAAVKVIEVKQSPPHLGADATSRKCICAAWGYTVKLHQFSYDMAAVKVEYGSPRDTWKPPEQLTLPDQRSRATSRSRRSRTYWRGDRRSTGSHSCDAARLARHARRQGGPFEVLAVTNGVVSPFGSY